MDSKCVADVCVFDSGVGGFTVLQALRAKLPSARYVYCCDNLNFPYGTKTQEEVLRAVDSAVEKASQVVDFSLLVIACNTASTIVLPHLRAKLNIPVVGVVPAIKPAAQMSTTNAIGLLATPATIRRSYTDDLLQQFAQNCAVVKVGSSKLVELAEQKWRGFKISMDEVREEIDPFIEYSFDHPLNQIDTIVLGCTHFPLLREELTRCLEDEISVNLIDSSEAISNRVHSLLDVNKFVGSTCEKTLVLLTNLNSELSDWMFKKNNEYLVKGI